MRLSKFVMKGAVLLALLVTGVDAVARDQPAAIRIALVNASEIPDAIVNDICSETEAIWGRAGIAFDWRRVQANDPSLAWRLGVTIGDQRRNVAPWQEALGWIAFTAAGPKPSIHLSRIGVEDLLLRESYAQRAPKAARDALVGRALGRALAHELGHYLFSAKAHTLHGLMRANWPTDEIFGVWRGGFELTPAERAAALSALGRTR